MPNHKTQGDPGGVALERQVVAYLRRTLRAGMLGVHADSATVYHRKKYYSEARKADITVDVSIEVIMAGTERPFLIWIWECKDYSRSVGIDDIQEFDAKLQQIGANNTKGTVITRRGFQRSAIEYAKSRGIGL